MIRHVVRKEVRDHIRDGRSILGAMALPVMGPLLLLLMFRIIAGQQAAEMPPIAVDGGEHAPAVIELFEHVGIQTIAAPEDAEARVRAGELPLLVRIPEKFPERIAASRPAVVEVVYDSSNQNAAGATYRVETVLTQYGQRLAMQRVMARGVAPSVITPVTVQGIDVASARQTAARAMSMIPLFLILMAFVGGMNVAIDTTAGERERGSLEPLLLNPIPRWKLVVGKWVTASIFASSVLAVGLLAFHVTLTYVPRPDISFAVSFGLREAALSLLLVMPLAMFGAAAQMMVALFARTFKEAQTYLSLFNFIPLAPAIYLMFESADIALWMALVPALGQIAGAFEILGGADLPRGFVALSWVSMAVYTTITLHLVARMLARETLIYGR